VTSQKEIIVTLLGRNAMTRSQRIPLVVNRFGQLPTVLINPRSRAGHVISGIWLGDPQDLTADGTTYQWVAPSDYVTRLTWVDSDA